MDQQVGEMAQILYDIEMGKHDPTLLLATAEDVDLG
jgi:hypothetical protein